MQINTPPLSSIQGQMSPIRCCRKDVGCKEWCVKECKQGTTKDH